MGADDPYAAFGEPVEAASVAAQTDQQPQPASAAPQGPVPAAAKPPAPTDDPYAAFADPNDPYRTGMAPEEQAVYDKLTPDERTQWADGKLQVPGLANPLSTDVAVEGRQEDAPPPEKPNTLSGLTEEELRARFDKLPSVMKPGHGKELVTHGTLGGRGNRRIGGRERAYSGDRASRCHAIQSGGGSVMDAYHKGRTDALAAIDYARLNASEAVPRRWKSAGR
jgi:hypothetical protein